MKPSTHDQSIVVSFLTSFSRNKVMTGSLQPPTPCCQNHQHVLNQQQLVWKGREDGGLKGEEENKSIFNFLYWCKLQKLGG